jgi:uncharacterized repeat protein (TIGR01451 family)
MITMTDTLPADVDFVGAAAGMSYDIGSHTVTWSGIVPGNANVETSLWIDVQVPGGTAEGTLIYNEAAFGTATSGSPFAYEDDYLLVDDGEDPDVSVEKTVDKLLGSKGEELEYTIVLENHGTETAVNVQLVDTLPDGVVIDEASITGGASYQDGAVVWTGDIAPAASTTVTYKVTIDEVSLFQALINGADVTYDNPFGSPYWTFDSAATEVWLMLTEHLFLPLVLQ